MNYESDYQDIFVLKTLSLPIINNEILAIGVSSQCLFITTKKNELYRWVYNQDDSLKTAYNFPFAEKEKAYYSKIFCDFKSNHAIVKQNTKYYYFNSKYLKLKLLTKLSDINVESIAFDETAGENSPNTLLIGTDKGKIFSYNLEYDNKLDKITSEKLVELIQLKHEKTINGIAVSLKLLLYIYIFFFILIYILTNMHILTLYSMKLTLTKILLMLLLSRKTNFTSSSVIQTLKCSLKNTKTQKPLKTLAKYSLRKVTSPDPCCKCSFAKTCFSSLSGGRQIQGFAMVRITQNQWTNS